jgi:leucyl-tRNA synthetase
VPPAKWTYENIAYMKQQMQAMGLAIDWSREVATCSPELLQVEPVAVPEDAGKGHRLPQDPGRQLGPGGPDRAGQRAGDRRQGLAHRRGGGKARDSGLLPEHHAYAEELLDHVQIGNPKATLNGWPDKVRLMQENWIGKSEGVRFAFTHDIRMLPGADR